MLSTVPEKGYGIEKFEQPKSSRSGLRIKYRTFNRSSRRQRDARNRSGSSPFKAGPPALNGKPFLKICCPHKSRIDIVCCKSAFNFAASKNMMIQVLKKYLKEDSEGTFELVIFSPFKSLKFIVRKPFNLVITSQQLNIMTVQETFGLVIFMASLGKETK
jgi:hypothetical protein